MARSIDPAPKAVRGFVPARSDEERYLMRHIEDLARTAESRGIPRYSAFLSDREQDLAKAALNRAAVPENVYHLRAAGPVQSAGSSAWSRRAAGRTARCAVSGSPAGCRPGLLFRRTRITSAA